MPAVCVCVCAHMRACRVCCFCVRAGWVIKARAHRDYQQKLAMQDPEAQHFYEHWVEEPGQCCPLVCVYVCACCWCILITDHFSLRDDTISCLTRHPVSVPD